MKTKSLPFFILIFLFLITPTMALSDDAEEFSEKLKNIKEIDLKEIKNILNEEYSSTIENEVERSIKDIKAYLQNSLNKIDEEKLMNLRQKLTTEFKTLGKILGVLNVKGVAVEIENLTEGVASIKKDLGTSSDPPAAHTE